MSAPFIYTEMPLRYSRRKARFLCLLLREKGDRFAVDEE